MLSAQKPPSDDAKSFFNRDGITLMLPEGDEPTYWGSQTERGGYGGQDDQEHQIYTSVDITTSCYAQDHISPRMRNIGYDHTINLVYRI